MNFEKYLKQKQKIINDAISKYLPPAKAEPRILAKAMRYSVLIGGKRIRPILVLAAAETLGGKLAAVLPTAVAIELIHTYSLIHDDLPAMDNDDLRRGKPASHKVFGEALAILAGDALMTLAYEIISRHTPQKLVPAKKILEVIWEIGTATGFSGMAGGQAVDLVSSSKKISARILEFIHQKKTGALIICSLRCGAILSGASKKELAALTSFGKHLGLAFQIVDDILDVEGTPEKLGKTAGKDKVQQKATYPAVFGLKKAKLIAEAEAKGARVCLKIFGPRARILKQIINLIIKREK